VQRAPQQLRVTAGVNPRTTVTVVCDGAVGLSAALAAKRLGADRIILMGPSQGPHRPVPAGQTCAGGVSRMSTRVAELTASAVGCQRNVNSTCLDDRGRGWTFLDAGGLLTCEDTASTGVRHRPRVSADVPCSRGS
jgi:hypothetical protein